MQKRPVSCTTPSVFERTSKQTISRSGFSDTDVMALTVHPLGPAAVTTLTPVAQ